MLKWQDRRIVDCVVLLYFVIYANSPLSTTAHGRGLSDRALTSGATSSVQSTLNIFFWELLCSSFLNQTAHAGHDDPVVKALFKKVRAVLPEDSPQRLCPPADAASVPPHILLADEEAGVGTARSLRISLPPKELNPLYSGHAPPLS